MKIAQTNFNAILFCKNEEESLEYLRDCGYTCVDVTLQHYFMQGGLGRQDNYLDIVDTLRRALDKTGLEPVQTHANGYTPLVPTDFFYSDATRAIEIAAKIGAPSITFHPGTAVEELTPEQFWQRNAAVFKTLMPTAEKFGIRLLVENIGSKRENYYCCNAHDMLQLIAAIDHELAGVCWDIGHANISASDPYSDITGLGDKLWGIHIHDNRGFSDFGITNTYKSDFHLPPMTAYIDFDKVLQGLIDNGYKGCFTLESICPAYKDLPEDSRLKNMDADIYGLVDTYAYRVSEFMLKRYGIFDE